MMKQRASCITLGSSSVQSGWAVVRHCNQWLLRIYAQLLSVLMLLVSPWVYAASGAIPVAAQCPQTPAGFWLTYDMHDGAPNGIMLMRLKSGVLSGALVKVINKPGDAVIARCVRCRGKDHNRVLDGMTLITGMRWQKDKYQGGHIFDPRTATTYKGKIQILHKPCRLMVRGFVGFSLLGKTVYWTPLTTAQAKHLMQSKQG